MQYKPKTAVWEVTFRCNVNCIHCGSDCISEEKEYQLTTAECFEVIEDLADIGTETVILSGGEPLMRKDIGAIAAMIKNCKMKLGFISNGYLVNENTIKMLEAVRPNTYGLSLDAANPKMHDYIRGKDGTFEHVMRAIDLLKEHNIVPTIVTTIHKLNYGQLNALRELLIEKGIKYWQVQYGDHIGRMPRTTMLTEAQFFEMAKFILDTQRNYKNHFKIVTGADVFGYYGELGKRIQGLWWGCQAGMKVLGIGSDGTLRGCLSLQMDKYIEGNIRERSLKEIWNDRNSFSYNRRFDCSMLTGHCQTCEYAGVCKGGCLRAASVHGGRCNPYCLYKLEKDGFSSEEQAKTDFTKEELFALYNPIRPLYEGFLNE